MTPFPAVRRLLTADRVPVLGALTALAIGAYQLSLPHVLTGVLSYNEGYDDGVYVGAAVRFVHGAVPYKDFVLVHPPGIVLLLSPIALIGSATTSHAALILARLLTVAVTALNPFLAGRLVRRQGRLVAAVACFALALWPLTVSVDRGVELEPYLICFMLLGAIRVFDAGRILTGGVLLGLACTVKVWGVVPALAAMIVLIPDWKKVGRLAVGLALGALVPCLPFFVASPGHFLHDIISAQADRSFGGGTSMVDRLELITGTAGVPILHVDPLAAIGNASPHGSSVPLTFVLVALLLAAVVVVYGLGRRRRSRLDWWVFAAAVGCVAMMLVAPNMADHYGYLPMATLAPLIGICAGDLRRLVASLSWAPVALAACGAAVAGLLITSNTSFDAHYLSEAAPAPDLAAYVPAGACVISDFPSDLLATDRFTSRYPGCPLIVDPLGTYLVDDDGRGPNPSGPYPLGFTSLWFGYLQAAGFLDLRIPYSDFIPWSQYMINWFPSNYRGLAHLHDSFQPGFVDTVKDVYIFRHVG